MKLLFATNNDHKTKEVIQIFQNLNFPEIEIINSKYFTSEKFDVVEDGSNYFENAFIKAKSFYDKFKIPTFSDDSGLEIDCLNFEPGLKSARYAGENSTDAENRNKVLMQLRNINDKISARFICIICFYDGVTTAFFEGKVEGQIIKDEKGNDGFGYDPIFIPDGYHETFSELNSNEKNSISHRFNALNKFAEFLKLQN